MAKQKAKVITLTPKAVNLTATQKIHKRVNQLNRYIPNTYSLRYDKGKIDIYANVFDPKKKRIVKHREHTFIEGTKREINIFLDGAEVPYIIESNNAERVKVEQKKIDAKADPKKLAPMAVTKEKIKTKEAKH